MKSTPLFKLAKELGVTSKEAMGFLKEKGIPAKGAISVLTPEQHHAVLERYTRGESPAPTQAAKETSSATPVAPAAPTAPAKEESRATPVKAGSPVVSAKEGSPATPVKAGMPVASAKEGSPAAPEKKASAQVAPVKAAPPPPPPERVYAFAGPVALANLAKAMDIKASDIIREMLKEKNLITLNQRVDIEVVRKIGGKFGFKVAEKAIASPALAQGQTTAANLRPRAPIVTIMGHVDHGKTSLLDAIRETNVAAGESGGITQHISAFKVGLPGHGDVVFLDTPGHEAFTSMRARGATVTDVIVLVVAADDGVMPQTVEAINHARAASVPIVVAINKIDRPDANPQRVKQELTKYELTPEEWGGKTIMVEVSALKKTGLDRLLEMLVLESALLELKADPTAPAQGVVLEARMHKGRGPVATVLILNGTLKVGDIITCGSAHGRVRRMLGDKGDTLRQAGPATPIELLGLSQVTEAGATLTTVADERTARAATERYSIIEQEKRHLRRHITLQDISQSVKAGEVKELRLILKADVQGSLEALSGAIGLLANEQVKLVTVHQGVGPINSSDIALAAASDAVIMGFHVDLEPQAAPAARQEDVEVRTYSVIYDAVEELKKAMEGLLSPKLEEAALGRIEVRATFRTPRGAVAGCFVTSGKAVRGEKLRVLRGGKTVFEGTLNSLRRFKEDVREVAANYECGISLDNYSDFQVGDVIETYTHNVVQEKLRI